ncbi:chloramphenicol acetyltransferase [Pedobacter cryoconitis]|uniref:Chloramphenicol O-acetyltransferase type A n=1 Tax=Pedobacter cryoconitis TaxID=188932 RepID=A0A7X0MGV3_9SPHI|nr:chloramphenicol acetyltransferase [Pedobacter cryoconitis]MBB6498469.1 chloramphenicol O-acetyltransferase type A [Pedobacter cryoconitis]
MKRELDINTWKRKEHFHFFKQFEEPFFGVTVKIDCSEAYRIAKQAGQSFFLYYLYQSLKAANRIEAFKYRIQDEKIIIYDQVDASSTVNRPDGTFGFSYFQFDGDAKVFHDQARENMELISKGTSLFPPVLGDCVIHYSALPWIDFTSLSHARSFSFKDSSPKISFGKMTEEGGRKLMSVSVHVHHALMDGYEVGQFVEHFQDLMKSARV